MGKDIGCQYQTGESQTIIPSDYPPLTGATEVWKWGIAGGILTSSIQADSYIASIVGTPGHQYGVAGTGNMSAIYWGNSGSLNSNHTAPGNAGGQSSGPVNANMKMGSSDFQFKFLLKTISNPQAAYYIMDYDAQDTVATFTPGIQFYYSTAGFYAPGSFAVLLSDGPTNQTVWYAPVPAGFGYNDNNWVYLEWFFNRSLANPYCKMNGQFKTVIKSSGIDLSAYGAINPTNGIRFACKEVDDVNALRADMQMCAATYAKNLTYTWA